MLTSATSTDPMSVIEKAVSWALQIAADNTHGYSQSVRYGPSYDCSSLIISAYRQAGIPLPGATYTGNMRPAMLSSGFRDVTSEINMATGAGLQRGDVLLNIANHTAMSIGGGQIVHARSSEGTSDTIDNSGNEIRTQPYYLYSGGWDCVLRYYSKETPTEPADTPTDTPITTYKPITVQLRELSYGDYGEDVRAVQRLLKEGGFDVGRYGCDGELGYDTLNAIKLYQASKRLSADGIVGEKTWTAILGGY